MKNGNRFSSRPRVTVMGLGLHGGGLATARYLHGRGAVVTVTDLRSPEVLAPAVDQLPGDVRIVLGEHREEDFRDAALVVKNPAVPRTSPLLQLASAVTTDIAIFFSEWTHRLGDRRGPLIAVTGTKGKSSTASATEFVLKRAYEGTRLGGNITVSPLSFLDSLGPDDPVVLELSSFQLGDLRFCREFNRQQQHDRRESNRRGDLSDPMLFPRVDADVALITSIFPDHLDYYDSMEQYVADKTEIVRHLRHGSLCIVGCGDPWDGQFINALEPHSETSVVRLEEVMDLRDSVDTPVRNSEGEALLPLDLAVAGAHMRRNLTMAVLVARHLGVVPEEARTGAALFRGVPHRLENLGTRDGITLINDPAATIPEAALAAARSYSTPVVLITGGSDKGLDLDPLVEAGRIVAAGGGAIVLLAGTATNRLLPMLASHNLPVFGPETTFPAGFTRAVDVAKELQRRIEATTESAGETPAITILLSPGCASFGMFRNEFDRGDQFRILSKNFLQL